MVDLWISIALDILAMVISGLRMFTIIIISSHVDFFKSIYDKGLVAYQSFQVIYLLLVFVSLRLFSKCIATILQKSLLPPVELSNGYNMPSTELCNVCCSE